MSLSTSLSSVAAKIIRKFGVVCTFTHEQTDTFDPATGVKTKTETTFTGYGVKDVFAKEEIDGTNVLSSDIKLVLERTDDVPSVDDTCAIGGISYRVMGVMDVDPADYDIIYNVQLRL